MSIYIHTPAYANLVTQASCHKSSFLLANAPLKIYFKRIPFISVAGFDIMVSRIGSTAPLLLLVDHFGTICDTIKSSVGMIFFYLK